MWHRNGFTSLCIQYSAYLQNPWNKHLTDFRGIAMILDILLMSAFGVAVFYAHIFLKKIMTEESSS